MTCEVRRGRAVWREEEEKKKKKKNSRRHRQRRRVSHLAVRGRRTYQRPRGGGRRARGKRRRRGRIGSSRMSAEPPREFGSAPIDIVGTYHKGLARAYRGGWAGRGTNSTGRVLQGAPPEKVEVFPDGQMPEASRRQGRTCLFGNLGAKFSRDFRHTRRSAKKKETIVFNVNMQWDHRKFFIDVINQYGAARI